MCQDCPTPRSRLKAVGQELLADLLLPFILYLIPVGALVLAGYWRFGW